MISLLDRYLFAIERALPKDVDAADVTAEIRDDLQSQIDDGTPEFDAIKAYGDPRVVAGRYTRVPYLIGPDYLPFYWLTLRNVLTTAIALVLLGGAAAAILLRNGTIFFDAMGVAWNTSIWIVVVVTLIFAIAERVPEPNQRPRLRSWDPRELPAPGALPPAKRYSALVEFLANLIAVLVLLDAPTGHHIPLDAFIAALLGQLHLTLTAAWTPAYYATLASAALLAGSSITLFLRPTLTTFHETVRAMTSAAVMVGLTMTLLSGPLFSPAATSAQNAMIWTLGAGALVMMVQLITSLRVLIPLALRQ